MDKNSDKRTTIKKAFRAAFPHTIPIFAGFLFLGFTYGVYMNSLGFGFVYPMVMSLVIFAGSMEFFTANMLIGSFDPFYALTMALVINARHLFYGISMLDKYRNTGLKKFYLIYGMCDESFSVNYAAHIPESVDKGWFMLFVNLLNQFYWFFGSTLGGILGSYIKFNTKGLEFVLTAMFTVIFTDQYLKEKDHIPAVLGIILPVVCLALFGAKDFVIPSMSVILCALTLYGFFKGRLPE